MTEKIKMEEEQNILLDTMLEEMGVALADEVMELVAKFLSRYGGNTTRERLIYFTIRDIVMMSYFTTVSSDKVDEVLKTLIENTNERLSHAKDCADEFMVGLIKKRSLLMAVIADRIKNPEYIPIITRVRRMEKK